MIKVLNSLGDDEYIDDRERDKKERKKFVDASKMRRVSKYLQLSFIPLHN